MKKETLEVIWGLLAGRYKNYVLMNISNPVEYSGNNPDILDINGKYVGLEKNHILHICQTILSNNKQL